MCSTVVYGNKAQKYLAENYDFTQRKRTATRREGVVLVC